MKRWGWLVAAGLALALPAASAASVVNGLGAPFRPSAFASCPALVAYAQAHFAVTRGLPEQPLVESGTSISSSPTGGSSALTPSTSAAAGAAASSPSSSSTTSTPAYSTTNDQEPGVDEPDIVKTNGSTIFTVSGETLYALTVQGGVPHLAGSLSLGADAEDAQLLLSGTTLLVIGGGGPIAVPLERPEPLPAGGAALPAIVGSPYYEGGTTVLSEVDASNPAAMSVTQTMTVGGSFVDARENGSTVRLVISSSPQGIVAPALRTSPSGWIPTLSVHDAATGRSIARPVVGCDDVLRPYQFSGLGMTTILTVNLHAGLAAAQAQSLMADAQVVYGSQSSLDLATQEWVNPVLPFDRVPSSQQTVIDRFDVTNPNETTFVASGEVPGYLLNQFSMSEYDGDLRVASTSRPLWWDGALQPWPSVSSVTVLATEGNELVPVGQVSGLGEGEQVSSVRFDGDSGYVSTFRQIDPFYAIDLSDPTAPRVTGELELEGDSSYLQPLGNGLLLGVGQSVDQSTNEPDGALLELFDVSDPADPRLVGQTSLGEGSSTQVTYDHHAFLYWPATDLVVLPVQISAPYLAGPPGSTELPAVAPFTGAIGFHPASTGISELGRVVQDEVDGSTPVIERSLVIGDRLYTLSAEGVMSSNLDTLAPDGFVAFPTPLVVPEPVPTPVPIPTPLPLPGVSPGQNPAG